MIIIQIKNENPFAAGWLACHMGLPIDSFEGEAEEVALFQDGHRMREETCSMENQQIVRCLNHGACHDAFLLESKMDEEETGFIRHEVSVQKA